MKNPLPLLVLAVLLQGCASMSREECMNNDMYSKGLADGEQGLPAARLAAHQNACGEFNIVLDGKTYLAGRSEGLKQYCTASNGEAVGRSGRSYQGVCPPESEAAFTRAYTRGKLFYDIELRQKELEDIRIKLANDKLDRAERKRLVNRLDQVHAEVTLLLLERLKH